jgi:hypothetical protein
MCKAIELLPGSGSAAAKSSTASDVAECVSSCDNSRGRAAMHLQVKLSLHTEPAACD